MNKCAQTGEVWARLDQGTMIFGHFQKMVQKKVRKSPKMTKKCPKLAQNDQKWSKNGNFWVFLGTFGCKMVQIWVIITRFDD